MLLGLAADWDRPMPDVAVGYSANDHAKRVGYAWQGPLDGPAHLPIRIQDQGFNRRGYAPRAMPKRLNRAWGVHKDGVSQIWRFSGGMA